MTYRIAERNGVAIAPDNHESRVVVRPLRHPIVRFSDLSSISPCSHIHSANLTTEYTPRERGAPPEAVAVPGLTHENISAIPIQQSLANAGVFIQPTAAQQPASDSGPDPSTLPPARAPPSHPAIDPTVPGTFEGRTVFDIDMANLEPKPWRRPGSDIGDWFNYGFDEISWEAYCYRRRDMGESAAAFKTNVLNFSGLQEEQLLSLPPEVRTMVMTGTNAMMGVSAGGGGGAPGMIPPEAAMGMNPMNAMNHMMDMGQMGGMGPMQVGMGPMGMGMNGEMGVGMPGGGPGMGMVQDGGGPVPAALPGQGPSNIGGAPGPNGTPEIGLMNLPDGMAGAQGMMGMNMNPDFMQVRFPFQLLCCFSV